MANIKDFLDWVERDITRFSRSATHIDIKRERGPEDENGYLDDLRIVIFTAKNKYTIDARYRGPDADGYLGAGASSRTPRAGEDWTRGNDLRDGALTEETWHEILGDIVSYEMVQLAPQRKGPVVPDGLLTATEGIDAK